MSQGSRVASPKISLSAYPVARQCGASLTEYVLILSVGLMFSATAYQQYGNQVRQHMAKMSNKFSEYYYEGWFWPEEDVASAGAGGTAGHGQSGSGSPASGGPSEPGSAGGSSPTAGGAGASGNGDGASNGSGGIGGNIGSGTGNSASGDGGNPVGNNFGNSGGAGGSSPLQCTGGSSGSLSSPVTGSATNSALESNASSFSDVGNPIDVGTGNKFQTEMDYTGSGAQPLQFARYYNSVLSDQDVGVGHGWRHSYQRRIVLDKEKHTATVWRDDGTQYPFSLREQQAVAPLGVIDHLEHFDDGWLYHTGSGDREHYDDTGRLLRVDTVSGVAYTFAYNAADELIQIADSRGARITMQWQSHHLRFVELPTHSRLHYTYDANYNLQDVRRTRNVWAQLIAVFKTPERVYHYDDFNHPNALTGLDDATGVRYATWGYDQLGRANLSQHGDGAERVTIEYRTPVSSTAERNVIVTNASGLKATYTLEPARPGKYRLKDIDGQSMLSCAAVQNHHRYDSNGFVRYQFNAERIGSMYTRNSRGLIEVEQRGLRFDVNETPYTVTGATRIERYWDQTRPWVLQEIRSSWQSDRQHPQGYWQPVIQRAFTYDEHGRVLADALTDLTDRQIPYVTKGTVRTRRYHYEFADPAHTQINTLTVVDANQRSTTYHYQNDQLQRITNALNQTTEFQRYNADGLAEEVHLPNGQTLHITYNDQGLPIQLERSGQDNAAKEIATAHYDAVGRLVQLIRPDSSEQNYSYNAAGQLMRIKNQWGETLELMPNALTGQWEEQALIDANGHITQRHHRRFNAVGQLAAVLGNQNQQTAFSYDANGDLITASEGHEDPARDELNHTTRAKYDTQHRLLELADAAGYGTHYEYSVSGHTEVITDANKNTTEYLRNGFGEVIRQNSQTTGSVIKIYDANGNLIENQSPSGDGIQFEYDALNRLTKVDYPGGQNDIHYTYDQQDNDHGNGLQQLTHIDTKMQAVDYRYDALGRKIQETTADKDNTNKITSSTTLKYNYLPGNRLASITYPDGSVVEYRYSKDRIDEVIYRDAATHTDKTILTDITYTPFGGPISWRYGNGLQQSKQLDQDGRVTDIALKKSAYPESAPLWTQHYQYDLYQNIEQINRDKDSQKFAYDALNRLILEQGSTNVKQYTYDPLSNRLSETLEGKRQSYRYGRGNQLQNSAKRPVVIEAGNTLIEKNDHGTQFMIYDQRNETRTIYQNKNLVATYGYDARGWRNRKTTRGAGTTPLTQRFVYRQDGKLVSEAAVDRRKNYIWLGETPIAQIEAGANDSKIVYLHTDHLNTPRVASNDQSKIVWEWRGDAFGNGAPNEDPDKDGTLTHINLRFPGQYADAETGLFYNLHRYYDPEKGRYTQSDPLGLVDGTNSFAYVHGNPLSGVDPLGLYERDVHYYMTFFLAVTAGMTLEDARTMALATQYIDDNPLTRPTEDPILISPFVNYDKLKKYHFTLWTATGQGQYDFTYSTDTNIMNPSSPQLNDLYSYATKVPEGECGYSTNQRLQFMGEYLHAFEDTFGHRDSNNKPIAPNLGLGHGLYGHDPDYTYNHQGSCSSTGDEDPIISCTQWNNADRTLEMEWETYKKIRDYMAAQNYEVANISGKQTDFSSLEDVLKKFNMTNENSENTVNFTQSSLEGNGKLAILENWLKGKYKNSDGSPISLSSEVQGYSLGRAANNRINNFRTWDNTKQTWVTLKQSDYPAAILPAG